MLTIIDETINLNIRKPIYLTGMMGSWKTTVGKKLAKALGWTFFDIDDVVERNTSMKVVDIFQQHGADVFREYETEALNKISKLNQVVVATGGGTVMSSINRKMMSESGFVIFFKTHPNVLADRIRNVKKRPVLRQDISVQEQLETLWEERKPYYESIADYTLNTDSLTPNAVVTMIKNNIVLQNANN